MDSVFKVTSGIMAGMLTVIVLVLVFSLTGVPPTTLSVICILVSSIGIGVLTSRWVAKRRKL